MPLLDIAVSQPCSCSSNKILAFRSETLIDNKLFIGFDKGLGLVSAFSWRNFDKKGKLCRNFNLGRAGAWRGGLRIKAVATVEITSVDPERGGVKGNQNVLRMDMDSLRQNSYDFGPQSPSEDSTEVDEKEKLRRIRISKANKGKMPWNKGKKHSPETLKLIKERTRLAMQDPKVKMKLANLGHAQSKETRVKIGVGVRLGWERRREKLKLQETCRYDWENLIAVAARKGLVGEEELQWDTYKILRKQFEQEWVESVEQRRNARRPKGSKRAPKSAEQKRKISEAIAAKWADPEYRNRVYSGLAKFHGITEGVERKPRRKPSGDRQTRKRSPKNQDETDDSPKDETKSQVQRIRSKRSKKPVYKDPLASSKFKMLKNIREERAAAMKKKSEAIFRAKLSIAEAEKAAEALEIAAKKSPLAHASLKESRMLIAEAIQLIASIDNDVTIPSQNNDDLPESSTESLPNVEEEIDADTQNLDIIKHKQVNGVHSLPADAIEIRDFSFNKFLVNGNGYILNSCSSDMLKTGEKFLQMSSNLGDCKKNPNGTSVDTEKMSVNGVELRSENAEETKKQTNVIKKWVRGRLVEVAEET